MCARALGFGSGCHVSQSRNPVMDARSGPGRDRRRHGGVTALGGDPATGRRVGPGRREVGPTRRSFRTRRGDTHTNTRLVLKSQSGVEES